MLKMIVPKVKPYNASTLKEAEKTLEAHGLLQTIDILNWKKYRYKPDLKFRIAHTGDEILLKYYVHEKYIRAVETRTHGEVYKDSTVEFFISLDGSNYYNFEFNCIGTIHLAYGPGRGDRKFVSPEIAERIEIESTLGELSFEEKKGDFKWEMMIRIPLASFEFDDLSSFNGLKATGNFYKCGDETTEPHFVTWNPVKTENPDYHRPEFFGDIKFE